MVGVITIVSLGCLAVAAAVVLLRRRAGVSRPEITSVSREWLMHHRADDHS
jgi:hypothetical protein